MGSDKAGLLIEGEPLWRRQVATLRAVEPQEVFISGRVDGPYIGTECEVVFDDAPDLGPLAGLAAALRHAQHRYLLVLAVDLPAMTPEFLRRLVAECAAREKGIVPRVDDHAEPLVAIYPRDCLPMAERALRESDRSLHRLISEGLSADFLTAWDIAPEERALFKNLNRPSDLPVSG